MKLNLDPNLNPNPALRVNKGRQGGQGKAVNIINLFINSDAMLNFEHIAMHYGLSRVNQLF